LRVRRGKGLMHDFAILYAEDEENDVHFLKRAFVAAGITNVLKVVPDGQQAIDYLSGEKQFFDRQEFPIPIMVLLDLKLPHRSGFEVLKWIREDPKFGNLLILIYSSSNQPRDIEKAYKLGANGYLVKQGNPDQLASIVRSIRDYWLNHNEPPSIN
jgi:CheY-like chemotaxis protein